MELRVGGDLVRITEHLDVVLWPVHVDGAGVRVDQPAEDRACRGVLFHLALEVAQGVQGRAQLDDEVRAEGDEGPLLVRVQGVEAGTPDS